MSTYFGNDGKTKAVGLSDWASAVKESQSAKTNVINWAQPEINAFKSISKYIEDPVALGFKVFFNYSSTHGLLADDSQRGSALAYLKRIGDTVRHGLLTKFINTLKDINSNRAYMFQTIDGLDTIRTHKPWERYTDDAKINLGMLEDITFSTQSLMLMYQQIWYDSTRCVEVLPANLRRFDCTIFIYAQGSYKLVNDDENTNVPYTIPNVLRTYGDQLVGNDAAQNEMYLKSPDLFNHVAYELSECEFLPWESNDEFHKPSNMEKTTVSINNIAFSFRYCTNSYKIQQITGALNINAKLIFDIATSEDGAQANALMQKYGAEIDKIFGDSKLGNLGKSIFDTSVAPLTNTISDLLDRYGSIESLKTTGANYGNALIDNIENAATNTITGAINSLFMGNVYDWASVSKVTGALTNSNVNGIINTIENSSNSSDSGNTQLPSPSNIYNKM